MKAGRPAESLCITFSDGLPPVSFKMMRRDFNPYHASASVVSFTSRHHSGRQVLWYSKSANSIVSFCYIIEVGKNSGQGYYYYFLSVETIEKCHL